jgi:tRNA A37 threonylcarbamoyladenosine biosynthesis protein TsaE
LNIYKQFIHLDLYNIQETEEFKHLGIENYLKEKNILCFEWGERMGRLYDEIKSKADVVYVRMSHKSENEREIKIMS